MHIIIQRIHDSLNSPGGHRVLIDRLWPRGISKQQAALDDWWKELAPSTGLRQWFHAEPDRFEEFREKYWLELRDKEALALDLLSDVRGQLILLYAARDPLCNHARVLQTFLLQLSAQTNCASPPCAESQFR